MNRTLLLLLLGLSLIAPESGAQCVSSGRSYEQASSNFIKVRWKNNPPASFKVAARVAMGRWNNSSCNQDGFDIADTSFPLFSENQGGTYDPILRIEYIDGRPPAISPQRCGSFTGLDIKVYKEAEDQNGNIRSCIDNGALEDTLTHELGHRLGLRDQTSASCNNFMMSQLAYNSAGVYQGRTLQTAECLKVMETNLTPDEAMAEVAYCEQPGSPCHDGDYDYCSPIVIPLSPKTRVVFTSPEDGVWFDLDGGGPDPVGWTREGEMLALLWRDLNANGVVDGGSELFGSVTPMLNGGLAMMGYEALAEFDAPAYGGNGNGWADTGDRYWTELRLWVDLDHDAISQPQEIMTPAEVGLYAIRTMAQFRRKKDKWGNWPRWWAPAYIRTSRGGFKVPTTDVFFVHGEH